MIEAHTDVVGSLLRPPALAKVRDRWERGEAGDGELKRAEDAAVDAAVAMQETAGIGVVTDGEMRRLSFQSRTPRSRGRVREVPLEAYLWGDWHGDEVGDRATERPPALGVREKLRRRRHLAAEDFVYLRSRANRACRRSPSPAPACTPTCGRRMSHRRLPHLGRLPGRRGRDHPRRDRRAGRGWAARTSSSMHRTTRC